MDIHSSIQWAEMEMEKLPPELSWRNSVLEQLRYCAAVAQGKENPERLEQLTMGRIVSRELDGYEPKTLQSTVSSIQYELQQSHLSYATKVRLGIHKRA
jgi:hypothetical protein